MTFTAGYTGTIGDADPSCGDASAAWRKRQRIAEMTEFLNEQFYELEEYDEQLVRWLIEKVTVFDDKLTVEFKSDVEIDIEI